MRRALSIASLLAAFALALLTLPLGARGPNLARYLLRLHILAADRTDRAERMKPGESVVCDAIGDMTSSISPSPDGPVTLSGVFSDPCSFGAASIAGRQLDIDNGYLYSGEGRADLVAPPSGIHGISFQYRNCGRMRVLPGFQSLPARWKRPGQLEVLLPSDEIPADDRPLSPTRCTLTVTQHDSVYLLLHTGSVVEVSQQTYWSHPGMRAFLMGNPETALERVKEFTVAAPQLH